MNRYEKDTFLKKYLFCLSVIGLFQFTYKLYSLLSNSISIYFIHMNVFCFLFLKHA